LIWSKLKRTVEALLADSVKQHLQLHLTRYGPGQSYMMNRAWITWDGEEISTFSTIQWLRARNALADQISAGSERQDRAAATQQAEALLAARGVYDCWALYDALEEYTSLPIEAALQSPNAIIRAWTMFDRRLGKRRLLAMSFKETDAPFAQRWYQLRCQAEGIRLQRNVMHNSTA
jgi:hypothetical protein